jgi:hypothetical protein
MVEPDLHALAYFSRNAIEASDGALEEEIAAILRTARENNRRLGVTGALLYSEGCFAQVLEGKLADVEAIFECVQCDPRHREVTILHFTPIQARSFPAWSMAFAGAVAQGAIPLSISGTLGNADQIVGESAGRELVAVLRDLIGRYDSDAA